MVFEILTFELSKFYCICIILLYAGIPYHAKFFRNKYCSTALHDYFTHIELSQSDRWVSTVNHPNTHKHKNFVSFGLRRLEPTQVGDLVIKCQHSKPLNHKTQLIHFWKCAPYHCLTLHFIIDQEHNQIRQYLLTTAIVSWFFGSLTVLSSGVLLSTSIGSTYNKKAETTATFQSIVWTCSTTDDGCFVIYEPLNHTCFKSS